MKRIGVVSYNIHCNFTNYGSALQSWALCRTIDALGCHPVLADYCPAVLADKNPLDPVKNMWDKDDDARHQCELSLPAIRENYAKFDRFYTGMFDRSAKAYKPENFDEIVSDEKLNGFVCGSDTIFCIDEFKGFENGYWANYPCMQGRSVAYAASFGDSHFGPEDWPMLDARIGNFKAIGLREKAMVPYISSKTVVPVARTIDPTLLLTATDYDGIAASRGCLRPEYLLLYTRRYNPSMERYAIEVARDRQLHVVEISLRAENARLGHEMRYDAGVEEFLALVRDASFVVTNSFHGLIFAVQFLRPFTVFSRESGDSKIGEVLDLFGLRSRLARGGDEILPEEINYDAVHSRIAEAREQSISFLKDSLDLL